MAFSSSDGISVPPGPTLKITIITVYVKEKWVWSVGNGLIFSLCWFHFVDISGLQKLLVMTFSGLNQFPNFQKTDLIDFMQNTPLQFHLFYSRVWNAKLSLSLHEAEYAWWSVNTVDTVLIPGSLANNELGFFFYQFLACIMHGIYLH